MSVEPNSPSDDSCAEVSPAGARFLRVSVQRGGVQVAKVSLPWHRIQALEEVMGPDLVSKVAAKNIDIAHIKNEILGQNCPPGEVFALNEGPSQFRVWLEA